MKSRKLIAANPEEPNRTPVSIAESIRQQEIELDLLQAGANAQTLFTGFRAHTSPEHYEGANAQLLKEKNAPRPICTFGGLTDEFTHFVISRNGGRGANLLQIAAAKPMGAYVAEFRAELENRRHSRLRLRLLDAKPFRCWK